MYLKSTQHLSVGNDVTPSDKNVNVWLNKFFISKFFQQHIQCIFGAHIWNRIGANAEFYQF